MGWLKSLFKRPDTALSPELIAAKQMGQNAAKSMAADLDEFITYRFGHMPEAYLAILNKNIDDAVCQTDHSPRLVARTDLAIFQENVTKAREMMQPEIAERMKEWTELESVIGGVDMVAQLTNHRLNDFCNGLTLSGLALISERGPEIKLADDKWRAEFPELAKLDEQDE